MLHNIVVEMEYNAFGHTHTRTHTHCSVGQAGAGEVLCLHMAARRPPLDPKVVQDTEVLYAARLRKGMSSCFNRRARDQILRC